VPDVPSISRTQLAALALLGVLVLAFLGRALVQDPARETAGPGGPPAPVRVAHPPAPAVLVHVAGAVRRPGVYRLRDGDRVRDAVSRAGGATGGALTAGINLAAKVADGQQVLVPARVRAGEPAAAVAGASADAAAPAAPVSLGSATLEQLDTLDGVGPATARKILEERTRRGGFSSVDDLAQIAGIGPRRLASLREQLTP
jgi:competence protein ComEA